MSYSSGKKEYVDVIVGGQAGSEGKGAVTAYLSRADDYSAAVRCGGSNAGHTVYDENGVEHINQCLPVSGIVNESMELYVGAESFFSIDELKEEVSLLESVWGETQEDRINIDPKAAIVEDRHRREEAGKKLGEDIGSTTHGIGAARIDKIWRSAGDIQLAEDVDELDSVVCNERVSSKLPDEDLVLLEGTQGTLLSMNQSNYYPNTTSQDCIASSFLSSAGLPPSATRDVWCVFRTYPIRVAGDSGPMRGDEISFEEIQRRAGFDKKPSEKTSVTGRQRRVFEWSDAQFEESLRLNNPNRIAVTFLDYLNSDDYGVEEYESLSETSKNFIGNIEDKGVDVDILKTGPKPRHVIDRRS